MANSKVTIPSSKTYNDILDNHYDTFVKDTSNLFLEEFQELDETPFMTMEHDLWTNSSKNSIVGVSGSYINRRWRPVRLALLAEVKNDGHDSEGVAAVMEAQLKTRYGVDIKKMVRFTISDTAPGARKISRQFDTTLQTDCAMHALNLCIGYGIGLKENVRNEYVKNPKTDVFVKKRVVVTKGGAFPEGGALIRKLRALNNFFASSKSPERVSRLREVQNFHNLPQLAALIDIDVRVASTIKLFQRSILNYQAFQAFFHNGDLPKKDKRVFNRITEAEWGLAVQMEAVMHRVSELALVESQSATMLSSTMHVLLRVASARMNSYKFSTYTLLGPRDNDTNERNFPRTELQLTDLSDLAHRCIKRTLYQIAERFPKPSVHTGMALLLDPRTKSSAKKFLRIQDTAEAVTDSILEETKSLMRVEHRVFYKGLHANDEQGVEKAASVPGSPQVECNSGSDNEADLIYGEAIAEPTTEKTADATLNAQADALLEEWLNFRVDWSEVARAQYPAKEECEKVLSKLSMRDKKRNVHVWNVEQLCGNIDVCRWFAEAGEKQFPSVAKLARVWLGRGCSTAFQERVFSTGSFVMSPLRTRTDNERAQRQLILRHNRMEIRRMEASKRQIW